MNRFRPARLAAVVTALAVSVALASIPTAGSGQPGPRSTPRVESPAARHARGDYDSRTAGGSRTQLLLQKRTADLPNAQSRALGALRSKLGARASIAIDPITRTPKQVARTDGFLTGPSSAAPTAVATRWIAANATALGMQASSVAALRLRANYRDIAGTTHLSYQQLQGGVPVFGAGLRVHVARSGRIISVVGPPVARIGAAAPTPGVSAAGARASALRNVGSAVRPAAASAPHGAARTTSFAGGDRASLVWFPTLTGMRLGWQAIVWPTTGLAYSSVVDASSGTVLYRQNLGDSADALVWENYPGAPRGGTQKRVSLRRPGWLSPSARRLAGPNAKVYSDVDDDDEPDAGERIRSANGSFAFRFTRFSPAACGQYPCSWDPNTADSWRTNRKQNGTQVFYFVNRFHDHLAASPIGFTAAAGNFEGNDRLLAEADDGADTDKGLPDADHVDNANMSTPPDGLSPRMQMYLFAPPEFVAGNGGDEADIVYHEYTHGLSNRLVVDANGNSTLGDVQAGSMGEAWSDWYAMDYLVGRGLVRDTRRSGDVRLGTYLSAGQDLFRTEPIDCAVGTRNARCPGTPGADAGGYTYADLGRIVGFPEVHADGEIWGQTLWDLRRKLGPRLTEFLLTRAMELSPSNPSMLDERDSILLADATLRGGRHQHAIWKVFAHRGMGFYAGSLGGDDIRPGADYHVPPVNAGTGSLAGTVTDAGTGEPLAGVAVTVVRQGGGQLTNPTDVTNAAGRYLIRGLVAGTYPKVVARVPAGYDPVSARVTITRGRTTTHDFASRRDWAASSGGASVTGSTGPDYTPFGCGPDAAIDLSYVTGWSTTSDDTPADTTYTVTPKSIEVELPQAIDVDRFGVDPTATCGDAGSASTGKYRIETSTDGTAWTVARTGTFTAADRGRVNVVAPTAGATGVRYVRFTAISPQVPGDFATSCAAGGFAGCSFMDLTELEVYGRPTP